MTRFLDALARFLVDRNQLGLALRVNRLRWKVGR